MCFSLEWFKDILIWLVIVAAIVAILRLLIPAVLTQFGWAGGLIMNILNIVVWAFVLIVIIIFAFGLIECLIGAGGGLHFPGWHR